MATNAEKMYEANVLLVQKGIRPAFYYSTSVYPEEEFPCPAGLIKVDDSKEGLRFLIRMDRNDLILKAEKIRDIYNKRGSTKGRCYLIGELLGYPFPSSNPAQSFRGASLLACSKEECERPFQVVGFKVPETTTLEEMNKWAEPFVAALSEHYCRCFVSVTDYILKT